MKHAKIPGCAFLLLIAASSFAQVNNIYIGPEGGPGLAVLWDKVGDSQGRKPLAAGTAGYAFQYNFTKIISVRTDISYQRTGAYYSIPLNPGPLPNSNYIDRTKLDYLTLPLLARASFGKKINFFIDAGPYFGALLREVDVVEMQSTPKVVSNNTNQLKRFDTGITEGLGILIPIGYMFAVSFEARDYTGLYNIIKPQPYYYSLLGTMPVARNNSTDFIFSFIYKLVLHKASKGAPAKDKSAESY